MGFNFKLYELLIMAEGILKYDLNDSDDAMAHMRAVKSLDMALALWDITHNTKKSIEWSLEGKELDKYEVLDLVFDRIHLILEEHNIKLDDLIN